MRNRRATASRTTRRPPDSRQAILSAAVGEFAAHGFRGATVDVIARRARVNKAMIYYHFDNKRALYLEILRTIFASLLERTSDIASSNRPPARKLEDYIDAFGKEADAHPYLPRLMMLEVADGARRLDTPTLRTMAGVFSNLKVILEEGTRAGEFREVNPLLTYFNVVSPTVFFRAAAPLRETMSRHGLMQARIDTATFTHHLKTMALLGLRADSTADAASRIAAGSERRQTTGDDK